MVQLRKAARGEPAMLPLRVQLHLVAARYGQSVEAIREWPADDFMDAVAFLAVTAPPAVRFER